MFIDEVFGEKFYESLTASQQKHFSFGHLFKTHTYYAHENLELWRPMIDPSDPIQTIARRFELVPAGANSFKHNFPLSAPKRESNEEFIVVRAKIRPVFLLTPEQPIENVETTGFRGKVWRKRSLVAQIYGLQDLDTGREEFHPEFVKRIREMEFPQLMFLPRHNELFQTDSILRFDECQSVFTPHLHHTGFALGTDLIKVVREQFDFLITGIYSGDYAIYRESILAERNEKINNGL